MLPSRGDGCSFLLCQNIRKPSCSPRPQNTVIIFVLHVHKWEAEAQTEGR